MSTTAPQPDELEPALIALVSQLHDGQLSPERFNAAASRAVETHHHRLREPLPSHRPRNRAHDDRQR